MLTRLIRLRLARVPRPIRAISSTHYPSSPPLPELSTLHLPETPTHPFPLYTPPSPPLPTRYEELPTTLDGLPSDRAIQIRQKLKLTRAVELGLEEYTEEDLRGFYAAVVQSGEESLGSPGEQRQGIAGPSRLAALERPKEKEYADLVLSKMAERFVEGEEGVEGTDIAKGSIGVRAMVDRLMKIADEEEEIMGSSSSGSSGGVRVPLGLISRLESKVLLEQATRQGDTTSLIDLLETLPRLGILVERDQVVDLLNDASLKLSQNGPRADEAETTLVLAAIIGQQASLQEAEHDALVQYHLISDPSSTQAIAHLRQHESLSLPSPQSTYNLVLHHLTTSAPNSQTRSTAWDLFTHMRLVAHPTPTLEVYNTMIKSCSASSDPKPEMARDLWLQMTQEQRSDPSEPEYTAYIRALCSTRGTYLEGFDVFRQMLARHHEVTYVPFGQTADGMEEFEVRSRFVPTKETWKALLEGTKRAGDLGRARWVLQEAVRLHAALGGEDGLGLDEEILASVFMTYAAWEPTLKRAVVRDIAVKENTEEEVGQGGKHSPRAEQEDVWDDLGLDSLGGEGTALESPLEPGQGGMFDSRVPTTSAEAVQEAQLLYDAIISSTPDSDHSSPYTIFSAVRPTTRLINSYLSVHHAHAASIADIKEAWESVTPHLGPEGRNGWSYLHALERCGLSRRNRFTSPSDRFETLEWAKQLWEDYIPLSKSLLRRFVTSPHQAGLATSLGTSPRQTERCWRAIIRVHALNSDTSTSLALLEQFYNLYPPEHILRGYSPSKEYGFSVRFTDPTTVSESDVPPHLLFKDVDVLHQRLVRDEQVGDVGRVKYFCQSYESALGKRRKWRLNGVGKARGLRKGRKGQVVEDGSGSPGRMGLSKGEVREDAMLVQDVD